MVPKSHWILPEEKTAVITFKKAHIELGYRYLTWLMIDLNIVYLSPASVLRILTEVGLNKIYHKAFVPKRKGYIQPVRINQEWHIDISYINFRGTFLFLICVLDGFSRAILAWNICERMETIDVECVIYDAKEKWIGPDDKEPRVISDNGPQFIAGEFKQFIKDCDLTHTRISVNHPQSNGKLERFHRTAKEESIRQIPQFTVEQVKAEFAKWIEKYNNVRLHSALGYVAPMDVYKGRQAEIFAVREKKLLSAKEARKKWHLTNKHVVNE